MGERFQFNKIILAIKDYFPLFSILSFAFFIRIYFLRYRIIPEGDGCHYISFAKDFIQGNFSTIGTYWSVCWVGLIAIFNFLFKDVEVTGRILSAIAGTILIAFSYLFAKRLFNKKIAIYLALLIAINFNLILFSTLLFTESLYSLAMISVAWLGWISLERKKVCYYFLLGLIIGFSYTVRNEALLYTAIFLPLIVINNPRKAFVNILSLFAGIILFILLIIIFYRVQYGLWTLGSKGIANFALGDNNTFRNVFELTEDFGEPVFMKRFRDGLKDSGIFTYLIRNKFFMDRLAFNFKNLFFVLPREFLVLPFGNYISWLFFISGSYFSLFINRHWRKKYLYILSFPTFSFIVVALCILEERKMVPFLPFYLFIICVGIYWIGTLFSSRFKKFVYFSLLISIFITSAIRSFNNAKVNIVGLPFILMKESGLWMRENLPQDGRIVVNEPHLPYYFYQDTPNNFSQLIYGDYATLIKYMKVRNAKYLAVYSWLREINPAVNYLFEKRDVPDLEFLKSIKRDDLEVLVYQLK